MHMQETPQTTLVQEATHPHIVHITMVVGELGDQAGG
jgi:hypothetical protein